MQEMYVYRWTAHKLVTNKNSLEFISPVELEMLHSLNEKCCQCWLNSNFWLSEWLSWLKTLSKPTEVTIFGVYYTTLWLPVLLMAILRLATRNVHLLIWLWPVHLQSISMQISVNLTLKSLSISIESRLIIEKNIICSNLHFLVFLCWSNIISPWDEALMLSGYFIITNVW